VGYFKRNLETAMIKNLENCQSVISKRARFLSKKLGLRHTYAIDIVRNHFLNLFKSTELKVCGDEIPINYKRDKISLFLTSFYKLEVPVFEPATDESIIQHLNNDHLKGLWDEEVEFIYDKLFGEEESWLLLTGGKLLELCDHSLKSRIHRFSTSSETYANAHITDHRLGMNIYYVLQKYDQKIVVILREIEPFFGLKDYSFSNFFSRPWFRQYIDLYIKKVESDIRSLKVDAFLAVEYICGFHIISNIRIKEENECIRLKKTSEVESFRYIEESLRKKGAFNFNFKNKTFRTFLTLPIPIN
jgi:hypothetical protein